DLVTLCRRDPGWAASRLTFERARHAEEVAALRAQLREVTMERENRVELREGGGHGMTTDPLDGLEQLRRIIDEQPEPAPESVMLGLDYCYAEWAAERARHAEEVSALRDQIRKVEGERDAESKHATEMEER